jgi:hypothetical protein
MQTSHLGGITGGEETLVGNREVMGLCCFNFSAQINEKVGMLSGDNRVHLAKILKEGAVYSA